MKTNIFRKYRHILISGMGASMIGGTIFSGSAYYFSDISVDVTKTMSLPAWRDRDTLFVSCSYSGNTYETLRNYTMAKDAGLDVVAVTHCGKLKELAEKNGDILVPIGGKPMQPRSAIGWFVGLIGGIIEDAGGPALRKELTNMLPDLRRYRDEIDDPCGGGSLEGCKDHMRKGARCLRYAGSRRHDREDEESAQRELEDDRVLGSASGVQPQQNRRMVRRFPEEGLRAHNIQQSDHGRNLRNRQSDRVHSRFERRGGRCRGCEGEISPGENLYAVMFGDYVSLFVASLAEKDSCNVDPIVSIKSKIRAVLRLCRSVEASPARGAMRSRNFVLPKPPNSRMFVREQRSRSAAGRTYPVKPMIEVPAIGTYLIQSRSLQNLGCVE